MNKESCDTCCKMNTSKALTAGLMATIVMTVVMALFGTDIMKALGAMLIGGDSPVMQQYMAGGLMHLVVGLVFAFMYAAFMGSMRMSPLFKGILFGTLLTAVAYYGMPVMADMISDMKGRAPGHNPCNPCAMHHSMNPCNPCGHYNPCNPCEMHAKMNPCNPCGMNPCNPCGGDAKMKALLMSWANHLVFGIVLALMYGSCRKED